MRTIIAVMKTVLAVPDHGQLVVLDFDNWDD